MLNKQIMLVRELSGLCENELHHDIQVPIDNLHCDTLADPNYLTTKLKSLNCPRRTPKIFVPFPPVIFVSFPVIFVSFILYT